MRTSRILTFSVSCALVCAAFSSCKDDKLIIKGDISVAPAVKTEGAIVAGTDISFEFQGGEVVIPLSMATNAPDADVEYTYSAKSDAKWCTVSVAADELTVKAAPAVELKARSAAIDIAVECSDKSAELSPLTLNVSQAALVISAGVEAGVPQSVAGASVDGTSVKFEYQGGSVVMPVSVVTNAPEGVASYTMSVKSDSDWASASVADGVLTIYVAPTATKEAKSAEVEVAVECSEPSANVSALKLAVSQAAFVSAMDMVLVDAGTFKFGEGKNYTTSTAFDATISRSYYIAATEVTQKLYEEVMGKNPSDSKFKGDNYPVNKMKWDEACEFCNKLSEREGLTPAYVKGEVIKVVDDWGWSYVNVQTYTYDPASVSDGYRLPTEAEWEFAAKGGAEGCKNLTMYSGADTFDEVGWYEKNSTVGSTKSLHEVGQKKANSLGIYDMSGNLDEWCYDWAYKYNDPLQTTDPATDPVGASESRNGGKIIRGGNYSSYDSKGYVYTSAYESAGEGRSTTGFRVVRTVKNN